MAAELFAMTGAEYVATMNRVMLAVHLLAEEPLADLRNMVEHAETLGPIIEPTAYQRGGGKNLDDQRRVLDAALELARVFKSIGGRS